MSGITGKASPASVPHVAGSGESVQVLLPRQRISRIHYRIRFQLRTREVSSGRFIIRHEKQQEKEIMANDARHSLPQHASLDQDSHVAPDIPLKDLIYRCIGLDGRQQLFPWTGSLTQSSNLGPGVLQHECRLKGRTEEEDDIKDFQVNSCHVQRSWNRMQRKRRSGLHLICCESRLLLYFARSFPRVSGPRLSSRCLWPYFCTRDAVVTKNWQKKRHSQE